MAGSLARDVKLLLDGTREDPVPVIDKVFDGTAQALLDDEGRCRQYLEI